MTENHFSRKIGELAYEAAVHEINPLGGSYRFVAHATCCERRTSQGVQPAADHVDEQYGASAAEALEKLDTAVLERFK